MEAFVCVCMFSCDGPVDQDSVSPRASKVMTSACMLVQAGDEGRGYQMFRTSYNSILR